VRTIASCVQYEQHCAPCVLDCDTIRNIVNQGQGSPPPARQVHKRLIAVYLYVIFV